jgi:hypothetical protein
MKFLRVGLGLVIAVIGFVAALVILVVLFLFFPVDDTLAVRLGWAVTVALVEGGIIAGTFYAFRKVVDPRLGDDGGA